MTRGGNTGRADRKRCRIMLASKLRFLPGCPSLNRTAFLSGQRSTEHLPLIKVPTVFTHGTADPFGSIDESRAAAALIPAPSEIVEVTGARHDLGSKSLDVPALAVDAALRLIT
jgi:predicted alpha/beta-hydrolase family hydrolase